MAAVIFFFFQLPKKHNSKKKICNFFLQCVKFVLGLLTKKILFLFNLRCQQPKSNTQKPIQQY